jgi:uncharacterized UPF0160 family protein
MDTIMEINLRSLATHDGTFHADEVTACALLALFNLIDPEKIVRSRDPELIAKCEYVCDVGGTYAPESKLFDHHQQEYQGPLSSAGMVLLYLKDKNLISDKEHYFFQHALIAGVDAHDNGLAPLLPGISTYSNIISSFIPIQHNCSSAAQNLAFMDAFYFARDFLDRIWQKHRYVQTCKEIIAAKMADQNEYLFFEQAIPWMEVFFELQGISHRAKFIIMPSGNHWKLRGIPPSLDNPMQVRIPLPKEWAGLLGEELQIKSGIPGAVFCHKGRFISVWETADDAFKALEYVLNNQGD